MIMKIEMKEDMNASSESSLTSGLSWVGSANPVGLMK